MFPARLRTAIFAVVLVVVFVGSPVAKAAHQTATVSPINVGSSTGFQVSVQPFDFGAAPLPTLHSYAAGHVDGKWVLIAGRTNGLHAFGANPINNFPPAAQNRNVWVIDPVSKQSWSRSLVGDPLLTQQQIDELTTTNNQFAQVGSRLYMTGGYGSFATGFATSNNLSAIDLSGIANWVQTGTGNASDHIRTIYNETFRVTGGAMYAMNGRMHLVLGQDFNGGYSQTSNGTYTNQVRSFDILDNGASLAVANITSSTPDPNFRRRDLNVFPRVLKNPNDTLGQGLVALSGVFTETNGAWTVPVEIDSNGQPTMADPNAPGTFKQGMNNYHSAKLGLYSEAAGGMHEVLFGGITLQTYDSTTQQFVSDDNLPFTSQITQINIAADGTYTQDLIGEFPEIIVNNRRLLYGANAEFFLADGIEVYDNGVIRLDELDPLNPTVVGYIFGGLFSNSPNTRGVIGAQTGGSNRVWEVLYTPVPEPGGIVLVGVLMTWSLKRPRRWSC